MLQQFDLEIRDKKGSENVVVDHFSRLELSEQRDRACIQKMFLDEQLMRVEATMPWYADYVNYLACKLLPPNLSFQ